MEKPLFTIEAVMRICGVCHAAHAIASAEAFEHALGIVPPRNGLIVREAIGLLNRVQSHIIHLTMLIQDLVEHQRISRILRSALTVLELVNNSLARVGGSPTHPKHSYWRYIEAFNGYTD